jgi:hypothetical protein
MDKKKLTSQVAQPVSKLPVQNTPIKLVELSDEALSQVCGGGNTTGNPGINASAYGY